MALRVRNYIVPGLKIPVMSVFASINGRTPRLYSKPTLYLTLAAIGALCYLAAIFDTFPGDMDALKNFQSHRAGWLDNSAKAASVLASSTLAFPPVSVIMVVTISALFWLNRRMVDAVLVLCILLASIVNFMLKVMVDRPRPDFSLLESQPAGPSFPSGHSYHSFLLLGYMMWIVERSEAPRWLKVTVHATLVLAILACGASRVYLGVHWPSDVVGGFILGELSLVGIIWLRKFLISRGFQ